MAENGTKVNIEDEVITPITEDDSTDWKARANFLEGKIASHRERTKELKSKIAEFETKPPIKESTPQQKTGFDYAEKAYLKASGIDNQDFSYLYEASQATGKDLDALLGTKYVQAELRERSELRKTENAMPSGTKGSGNTAVGTLDYWMAKMDAGTAKITDIPDQKMRWQALDARKAREKQKSVFTDQGIA